MNGRLSTHVLDISCGKPAEGVFVELWQENPDGIFQLIRTGRTNQDGRLDQPLLEREDMVAGCYELRFQIGSYYRNRSLQEEEHPFLDCVPVRFNLSQPHSHYHVPLLIAPGGYSTYRGS